MKLPSNDKPVVMIVDDQYRTLQSLPRMIQAADLAPFWVPDARKALNLLKAHPDRIRIVIIDLKSSGMGGGGFLQQVRTVAPRSAVLILGPLGPFLYQDGGFYELAGHSIKQDIDTILLGIVAKQQAQPTIDTAKPDERKDHFGVIIGKSKGINDIYSLIDNLKNSHATVLILGESGTGKELVARTIHQTSRRKTRPFVAINCGAIPSSLMESELFGHERGAFTSADRQRKGKFEIAHGGTLFLDEIGEMEKDLQVKLLRVLQEKEFQRVGGNTTLTSDVRILAATSQDLKTAVANGFFREDLFYRLHVVPIHIPPLRDRQEDIPLLLDHFYAKFAGEMGCGRPRVTETAQQALYRYDYPGNIRELMNIVERTLVTCADGRITLPDLPESFRPTPGPSHNGGSVLKSLPTGGIRFEDVEKELIFKTLELTGGNKMAAAKTLGITRRRLYLRLSQYGLGGP